MATQKEYEAWRKFLKLREQSITLLPPNLIGVGAARCGTTTMYHWLKSCPDIFVSGVKELVYFSHKHPDEAGPSWDQKEYLLFFEGGQSFRYRCEITPHYLHHPKVPGRIKALISEPMIIVMLRNPVRRALSHFRHHAHAHKITDINEYFSLGLKWLSREDKEFSWKHPVSNLRQSFYLNAVKRYFQYFGKQAVKVIYLDDLINQPEKEAQLLSEWLGVQIDSTQIRRVSRSKAVPGSGSLRKQLFGELENIFADDFAQTCRLLERNEKEFTA